MSIGLFVYIPVLTEFNRLNFLEISGKRREILFL